MKFRVDINVISVEDVPGKAERVVVLVVSQCNHLQPAAHLFISFYDSSRLMWLHMNCNLNDMIINLC